jgi:oligogalacturonide transport system substrate-binding protein
MRKLGIILVGCLCLLPMVLTSDLAAQGKSVTLRFSWWGGEARHKATIEAVTQYMKLNPNVTIQTEYSGAEGYLEKKKVELASGTAPDVMQIDQTWMNELIGKGDYFVDLSKQKGITTSTFDAGFLKDFCIYNSKLLGLPTGMNAQVMLVNKAAATKMGVNIANLSTWEGFLAEGKKLHAKDKEYYLLQHDTGSFAGEVVVGMCQQLTGKYTMDEKNKLQYTKADYQKMFTWIAEAAQAGVLQPVGEAALYNMKGEQNPKWINQQLICHIDWASNYSRYLLKDVDFVLMLPPNLKTSKSGASNMRPSQLICLNAKSANVAEAAKFLNWLLNDKASAVILGDVRSTPVSQTAREAATAAGKINKMTSDALAAATKSMKKPERGLALNRQLIDVMLDVASKVEFGALTPEQAADEYIKQANAKIEELTAAQK